MRAYARVGVPFVAGLLTVAPGSLAAGALTVEREGTRVQVASVPDTPNTKSPTAYEVRLTTGDGTPIVGATVSIQGRMADGMSVIAPLRRTAEPGVYRGRVLFTMEGTWDLRLRVAREGKRFEVPLTEHVGR
jgi:hypothetical protein